MVEVVDLDTKGATLAMCSGTAVAPQVVLTAAHCLAAEDLGQPVAQVAVRSGSGWVVTTEFHINPRYKADARHPEANDIGVVVLPTSLSAPTMPLLSTDAFIVGEPVAIAGYGKADTGNSGQLRAGIMTLYSFSKQSLVAVYDHDSGSNTCQGDSGGPLAVLRSGNWVLAGVSVAGTNQSCGMDGKPDISTFANVSSPGNEAFLAQYLAR